MILSSEGIKDTISRGAITIEPFAEAHLKEASYTFHLGDRLVVFPDGQTIDPERGEAVREELVIGEEGYVLAPGAFVMGRLQERLTLDSTVACLLTVRGSCAQIGLNALNSDFFSEPNWSGHLALAIKNVNTVPVRLRVGMKIVKGIFICTTAAS